MVLDATKRAEQRALLEAELESVGIRLNREPPNIYLKAKKAGGMKINFQSPPKYLDEKMVYNILRDYKMLNCEVLVRDENATVDDFIDVIMKDHRKYIKCLYVYNKIDSVSLDFLDKLAREPNTCVMSCELDLGIEDVVERCWKELQLMRVYTKRKGVDPDFSEALIVRKNSTIEDVCDQIHRTLKDNFKYALVWGGERDRKRNTPRGHNAYLSCRNNLPPSPLSLSSTFDNTWKIKDLDLGTAVLQNSRDRRKGGEGVCRYLTLRLGNL
ncbi:hypothetical protein ACJ72_04740 [Emergomyces africanus]|uniref:OBG-type G domain-containing protein n=1 Tax=Emergomyces africanus TaxID=1955775 RepID=A0A1B7NVV8_9EURO|nr:hypothetical protein ACJ72_04740 [Emergomyces africanus]